MDRLHQLIEEKERECAELDRQSVALSHRQEVAQIELRTLKLAASVVGEPAHPPGGNGLDERPSDAVPPPPRRGPKTLWSLSEPYRRLVSAIIANGNPPMYSHQIADLARTVGLNLAPKHASGRFRKYVVSGMAERVGDQYRLTAKAVRVLGQNAPPGA